MSARERSTAVPLTRMRRAISRSMSASALVPQFTVEARADLTGLIRMRKSQEREVGRWSISDAIVAATAKALRRHPDANSSFADDSILVHDDINIGIAISVDDGLVAPAIQSADERSIFELREERDRLAALAHAGELTAEDLLSATFTISNLGSFGVERFRALVVPPQAAILAISALSDGRLPLALSCDHRILDGVPAERFLTDVVAALEDPAWIETR